MANKEDILTAVSKEMQRHNSVKRRINLIGQIIAWGWVFVFVILSVYAFVCPAMQRHNALTKTYQYEKP